jgi:hypothetical protein
MYSLTLHNDEGIPTTYPIDSMELLIAPADLDTEPSFTWWGCTSCFNHHGRRLGADVRTCIVRLHSRLSDPDAYYEVDLCPSCEYRAAYGADSIEDEEGAPC